MPYPEKESEVEYERMVFSLGSSLIGRHEYALFKEFIISVRPFYDKIKDKVIPEFIQECLKHYAYECLVSLFAFSGHKSKLFEKTGSHDQQISTFEQGIYMPSKTDEQLVSLA